MRISCKFHNLWWKVCSRVQSPASKLVAFNSGSGFDRGTNAVQPFQLEKFYFTPRLLEKRSWRFFTMEIVATWVALVSNCRFEYYWQLTEFVLGLNLQECNKSDKAIFSLWIKWPFRSNLRVTCKLFDQVLFQKSDIFCIILNILWAGTPISMEVAWLDWNGILKQFAVVFSEFVKRKKLAFFYLTIDLVNKALTQKPELSST